MRILGIIPARGGSKGIPRKNVRLLAGKPLLYYTAEAALASSLLTRVILSTDDLEIAEIGKNCGLEVPFIRPSELAKDDTPTLPVIQHAVHFIEENEDKFDAICLLQPTNPLRTTKTIEECIKLYQENKADSVITILQVPHIYNPYWVYLENEEGNLELCMGNKNPISQRQLLPKAYHREGSIYITNRDVIINQNSLFGNKVFGFLIDKEKSVNVDTIEDWIQAEKIIKGLT